MNAWEVLESIPDPEVPVVSIVELGIVREVKADGDAVEVAVTPTYSGCPAMEAIEEDIVARLREAGWRDVRVRRELSPPWTTDWIGPDARAKLREFGIAPPAPVSSAAPVTLYPRIACPRCGGSRTERVSEFGSTACKAHYRCLACLEPFDYFKPL